MSRRTMMIPLAGIVLALFSICSVAGQEPARTKGELIKELLTVMGIKENASQLLDAMIAGISDQYPRLIERMVDADPDLTPEQRQKIKAESGNGFARFAKTFREKVARRINLAQAIEEISSSLYDKYFTEAEIKDLITFYKTPTGKKAITVLPQLFGESMQKGEEKLGPTFAGIMSEILIEEKERLKKSQ